MQGGAAFQALIHLLSTKEPCHPRRVSLTNSDKTHRTPKMESTSYHKILALPQWRRIWSMDSTSSLHKAHLLTNFHPLLWSWSNVKTFLEQASQLKKLTFTKIHKFQIIFKGKGVYNLSPTRSKALLQRRPLCYLPSTLFYPPPSSSLSVLGALKETSP